MDTYVYTGRNQRGEVLSGSIESPNQQAVASWMLAAGIAPIKIEVQQSSRKNMPKWLQALQRKGVKLTDLLLFTRQMATMIRAGVPMMQSLASIQKSTANEALQDALIDMRADLDKGQELSSAMARHPRIFNEYYVNMVKVGEGTGQLEEIFRRLHEQLEFDSHMRNKIKSALRYPTFVISAVAVAIAVLTIFVIPVFGKIYEGFHTELPFLTRLLLGTSAFAVNYWWSVLAVGGFAFYAFRLFTQSTNGRYQWDKFKLRMPLFGKVIVKSTLARFSRSFATATKSGVPIVQAFTLVSRVVDNAFYEERILAMRTGVERGESMLRVAQSAGIFSPMELQMIAVGEETGDIEAMLNQVAQMYREEVEYEVEQLSDAIEPLLLAIMGVLVAILMLGIFLPLWDLGQVALHKAH